MLEVMASFLCLPTFYFLKLEVSFGMSGEIKAIAYSSFWKIGVRLSLSSIVALGQVFLQCIQNLT